jgi:hypothetical protein
MQAEKWTAPLRPHYAALAQHPLRSVTMVGLRAFLVVWRASFPVIMAEMTKPRWPKTYFVRYQRKQSALTAWFAMVKRGRLEDGTLNRPVTFVFGDGVWPQRGRITGPTAAVKAAAVVANGWNNTFTEWEYGSSARDAVCGGKLLDVYMNGPPTNRERSRWEAKQAKFDRYQLDVAGRLLAEVDDPALLADGIVPPYSGRAPRAPRAIWSFRLVWGLKYCAKPDCPDAGHRLKCRDVNASRNILAAFLARVFGRPRPAYLCPAPREPPGPKIVYCLPPPPPPPPRLWR